MKLQHKKLNSIFRCRSCNSDSIFLSITKTDFPLYIWPLPKGEKSRLEDINVYICNECGYIQLQDIDDQTISEIYRDKAFNIENESQNTNRYKILTNSDKSKFDNKKVLEVGGGRNSFINNIPNNSEKWVADFDIDKKILPTLNGSLIGDFLTLNINQNNFDYIFMFHILEHFNNPGLALQKARDLLNKEGRLIVEVPNFDFVSKQRPHYALFHMHISMFTEESLLSILMRYGFTCITMLIVKDVLFAEFSLSELKATKKNNINSLKCLDNLKSKINKSYFILQNIFEKLHNSRIAIFGAGGSSTLFLYNYPFLIEKISYAFDNDKNKIGRFICNGKIPIISPVKFKGKIDYVIVLEEKHIKFMNNNSFNYINIKEVLSNN